MRNVKQTYWWCITAIKFNGLWFSKNTSWSNHEVTFPADWVLKWWSICSNILLEMVYKEFANLSNHKVILWGTVMYIYADYIKNKPDGSGFLKGLVNNMAVHLKFAFSNYWDLAVDRYLKDIILIRFQNAKLAVNFFLFTILLPATSIYSNLGWGYLILTHTRMCHSNGLLFTRNS